MAAYSQINQLTELAITIFEIMEFSENFHISPFLYSSIYFNDLDEKNRLIDSFIVSTMYNITQPLQKKKKYI